MFRNRFLLLEGEPEPGGTGPGGTPAAQPPKPNDQLALDPNLVDPIKPVSYTADEYNKIILRNKALTDQRDTYQSQLKTNELNQMKSQEQWKEISELKETENAELTTKLDSMSRAIVQKEKMSEIRTAALQAGLRKEALDDLDLFEFPEVQIETTSLGNFKVLGAKTAVESLKVRKPYLFGKKSGTLNTGLPEVTQGGSVTIDQIMKAADKARKSNSPDDNAEYVRLNNLYNQQRRGN